MRDYQCSINEHINIAELLTGRPVSETMLYDVESIVEIALLIKDSKNNGFKEKFCKLPFDHILEAESLGAKTYFDKERMELRLSGLRFDSFVDVSNLPEIDFQEGRMNQVLTAAEFLIAKGENVILNVSGPFTILNGLIPVECIFRGWKKEPELMGRIFTKLIDEILRFVEEGRRRGIKFFSYADSLGGVSILGPKLMEEIVERYTYPLIREVKEQLKEDEMLILCPKTSLAFIDLGKAAVKKVQLSQPMSYQEGILEMQGKCKIVGLRCINQSTETGINDWIGEICLHQKKD